MPISPITLQRRHAELGRIRLGAKRNGNGAPMKLEQFRFTSHSERYINDLAALYGGEARPWDNNGVPGFEVYTDATSIPVIAVKGGLSQWMETWSGGGCVHRCDGQTMVDGTPCDQDQTKVRARVDGRDQMVPAHDVAKPTTRLSVMLPELEAIGVWRLESHGWNAAAEIPAVAELAMYVGDLVPADLHLVERRSIKDGKTSRFVVPVLDLQIGTARLKEIVAERSGATPELASTERPALTAAQAPAADGPDEFTPLYNELDDARSLEDLTTLWGKAREQKLVGTGAADTLRAREFVEKWKARAHHLKSDEPASAAPTTGQPDADGIVDAELVDDGDADAVWTKILAAAGHQGMGEADLQDHFAQVMGGLGAGEATADELRVYLKKLQAGATEAVPA